jgi:hypothetical protein
MSVDAQIAALIAALNANTEALKANASGAATTTAAADKPTGKGKATAETKKADEPKITQDQVNAALIKIKDDFGMEHAKTVISEHGKVAKMSEIKPAQFQAVFDAAVAKHAELTAEAAGEEGGDL